MTTRTRRPADDTPTDQLGALSPRRNPTLRLPAVATPPVPPAPSMPVAPAMSWAPAPRRTRPGRQPLTGVLATVGRYLQRHLDERRDDDLTALAVISALRPDLTAAQCQARVDAVLPVIRSLRDEGRPWLIRVDADCASEPPCGTQGARGPVGWQDELCDDHWAALGGWWAVQAAHVRTLVTLLG